MKILSVVHLKSKSVNDIMVLLAGVALLFAASQVEIPLKPVPITLQTIAVMLIGLTYTPHQALASHLIWIGLGVMGCPVFAGFSGGVSVLAGPTAGYIFGFVISSYVMARFKEKLSCQGWLYDMALCLIGTAIIFAFGVLWLSLGIGFTKALTYGVLPFILPGIVKAGLLCTALKTVHYYKYR